MFLSLWMSCIRTAVIADPTTSLARTVPLGLEGIKVLIHKENLQFCQRLDRRARQRLGVLSDKCISAVTAAGTPCALRIADSDREVRDISHEKTVSSL
jgi:hypothetical protein